MSEKFRVAVAQCLSLVGQVEANLTGAAEFCEEARRQGADLILFPEAYATGYSYRNLSALVADTAETMSGPIACRLGEMAQAHGLVVCCGMFEREGDRFFNTHVVAFPDGRRGRQRKGIPAPAEESVIALDPTRQAFEWAGTRFGILVCADNALEDAGRQFAARDISLLLHPCAGRILRAGPEVRDAAEREAEDAFQAGLQTAWRLGVNYAAANPIGFSGEDFYPGNSWIIHPDGSSLRLPATALPSEMQSSLATAVLPRLLLPHSPDTTQSFL